MRGPRPGRRKALLALAAAAGGMLSGIAGAQARSLLTRVIPSSGERIPVVGLGTWITFNVGRDPAARSACTDVMRDFFALGGRMIDSSPMYASSQDVVGEGLARLGLRERVFAAEKVWISAASAGRAQIDRTRALWGLQRLDLLQVHNLLAWEEHLPALFDMKARGEIRYVGITTSEGRRHREIEDVMRRHPVDFVQLSYSAVERDAEQRLLPLAQERRIAVIANRPFREGPLVRAAKRQPLPAWAAEIDCTNWAQLLLKFVVSHPAITCAIPATSRVAHVRENMGAASGRLPDEAMRKRIAALAAAF